MGFSVYMSVKLKIPLEKLVNVLLIANKYENDEYIEIYNIINRHINNNDSDSDGYDSCLVLKENHKLKVETPSNLLLNIIDFYKTELQHNEFVTYPSNYYSLGIIQFEKIVYKFYIKIILESMLKDTDYKYIFELDVTFNEEYIKCKDGYGHILLEHKSSYKCSDDITIDYENLSDRIKSYKNIYGNENVEVITTLSMN